MLLTFKSPTLETPLASPPSPRRQNPPGKKSPSKNIPVFFHQALEQRCGQMATLVDVDPIKRQLKEWGLPWWTNGGPTL